MKTAETVQAAWASYRQAVIPASAGAQQLDDCEATFYAGVQWLYITMKRAAQEPETFNDRMQVVGRELLGWAGTYMARHMGPGPVSE